MRFEVAITTSMKRLVRCTHKFAKLMPAIDSTKIGTKRNSGYLPYRSPDSRGSFKIDAELSVLSTIVLTHLGVFCACSHTYIV